MKTLLDLQRHTYTLHSDAAVSFDLVPLSSADKVDILYTVQTSQQYGHAMLKACEACVVGWNGVLDEKGHPVPFSKAELSRLDVETLIEVSGHILADAQLTDEEKKA